jgi:two-component system sensor histidine kinase/response regulator
METDLDDDQVTLTDLINRSGERLLRLVSDILDFSRIEAGALDLRDTTVHLHLVVEEAVGYARTLAEPKGLNIVSDVDPALPDAVVGDALRISQVLSNLLENAVKFTEHGQVTLSVQLLPDGAVRFQVEDTGIGIPEHQLDTLFQAFTQADGSATRKYGGTGLGLAICQELASLMGGHLTAESTPEQGSTFAVTLPFKAVPTI